MEIDDFELFTGRGRVTPGQTTVTIQQKGILSMPAATYELLGEPKFVELLYSRSRNIIGIRAADGAESHAIPVLKQTLSQTYMISGRAFTGAYGLRVTAARRYPATLEGNTILVDLNGPSVLAHASRRRKQPGEGADEPAQPGGR